MSSASSLIPNYSFKVIFDFFTFGFSKVDNISGSIDVEPIINGGHNDAPVLLRKPKRSPDYLRFEKGTHVSMKDLMFSYFTEGRKVDSIIINVQRNGKTVRIFSVSDAIIVRREYSSLDAMGNEVFLEAVTVAHSGLTEIALPFESPF